MRQTYPCPSYERLVEEETKVGELDTKRHDYPAQISWTGNRGAGTRSYRGYDRTWNMESVGKPVLECSNDPHLGGDQSRYNADEDRQSGGSGKRWQAG